jgi:phage-related minor tail protein
MSLDVTTLAFAVDSTQVTGAAAALDKMAASGERAETTQAKLAKASSDQSRALGALTPAANKGALAFKSLAEAQEALGPAAAAQLAAAGAFGTVATQAATATAAVHQLGAEAQRTALTWREFVGQRMGAAMKDLSAQGVPHKEAHTMAIRQIAEEWRRYKETGVAAQSAVAGAIASTTAQATAAKAAIHGMGTASAGVAAAPKRISAVDEVTLQAARAKTSLIDLSGATTALGASSGPQKLAASLNEAGTEAARAAREVNALRAAALAGPLTTAGTSAGAAGAARAVVPVGDAAAINALATAAARAEGQVNALGDTVRRSIGQGARSAQSSIVDLTKATTSLGASSFTSLDKASTSLGATAAKADEAALAVHRLQKEVALVGPLAMATTSMGATTGPAVQTGGLRGAIERAGQTQVDPRLGGAAGANALAAAAGKANTQVDALAKTTKFAAFQQQQLGFQIHDFFVQVASGQSPITAFVQQGSQLSGTFGGAGNAFRAVTSLITPMRLAIGGAVSVVGTLAFAFHEGQQQSRAFADAIQLSGNFAGQTEGKFNALAVSVAKAKNAAVGNTREIGQALLATGEIGPQVFEAATQAAVGYAAATGKTAEEVAKDFALMTRAPSKFAAELNRHLNFITAAQYDSIKAFEDTGRAADAQAIVLDALNTRFPSLEQNLKGVDLWLNKVKNSWSGMWNAAKEGLAGNSIESKLADVERQLKFIETNGGSAARRTELTNERNGLLREQGAQVGAALAKASDAVIQKEAIDAKTSIDQWAKRGKAASLYGEELAKLKRGFEKNALAGTPVPKDIQDAALKGLKQSFAGARGRTDHEPDQIRRENLANRLDAIQAAFQREREALAFNNRFLEGEYRVGNKSLAEFWDERRATTAAGVAGEIAELEKKKGAIQEDLDKPLNKPGGVKDPSERLKLDGDIKKLTAQQEALRTKAAQDATLANQEEAASFKQLADQVLNYRANLLQLQGDEVGAAKLRAQIAIEQASLLAKQAQPRPTTGTFARMDRGQAPEQGAVDLAGLKRALDQQNALTDAKNKTSAINQVLQLEEDRIGLSVRTGAAGEIESLNQLGAARAKAVTELEKVVKAQEEVAKSRPQDSQLQIDTSRARLELDKLKAELDPLKDKFDNLFKDAGATLFSDLGSGKSLKGAVTGFVNSIGGEMNKIAGRGVSEMVFGKGGPLAGAGGFMADLFGGKKKAGSAAEAMAGARPQVDTSAITASLSNLQAAGADPATSALVRLQQAADAAAGSLGKASPGATAASGGSEPALTTGDFSRMDRGQQSVLPPVSDGTGSTGDFARFDRGQTSGESSVMGLFKDASKSGAMLADTNAVAATSILQFAQAAARGQGALSQLPSIIQMIIAATSSSGGAGGGGGFLGSIFSLFGGGSTGNAGGTVATDAALELFFHRGGIVGVDKDKRPTPRGVFAEAGRYHRGGTVAGAAVAGLKADEVPAILMGGPKGKREEVLHASDPRHRDNLSPVMAGALGVRRYHTGGIAGLMPNERRVDMLKPVRSPYLTTAKDADNGQAKTKGGGDTYLTVQVTAGQDTTPGHAMNMGREAGRGAVSILGQRRRNT